MKILFVCSGGMSSSIAIKALEKEANKQDVKVDVKAVGSSALEQELENSVDVVMVAPQIKHRFKNLKEIANDYNVPIDLIEPTAYSPMGGKKLLSQALSLSEE
ncbi:PTS sugar transporter subunit IIB [Dolosigranulum savutiense]|uniref:PTS sugar transporter subunit IIB n=1 Tax=Dolosigranulum savutiense TaxID=3110288 RepID=A0AB74U4N5_9LACT